MFNQQANTEQFNHDHLLASEFTDSIEFDGYSLMTLCPPATTGIMVQTWPVHDVTGVNIAQYVSELIDGGGVLQKKYWPKTITIELMIQWSSNSDLVERIGQLKKNTQGVEAPFDLVVLWETRRYTATVTGITFPRFSKNDDYLEGIQMQILITSPLWSLIDPTSTLVSGVTGDFQKIVDNESDVPVFANIIMAFRSTWNALTAVNVNLKKVWDLTGYDLTITETITNSDVLIIDYVNKIVTLNWVEVNFAGIMTAMVLWYNVFNFDFTGTVSADVYISYKKIYL